VTLVLKPKGPGNWAVTLLTLEGRCFRAFKVRAGDTFPLGGVLWRVCEVRT
jgi:hypothetical protein